MQVVLCQSKAEVEIERSQEPWDTLYSNPQRKINISMGLRGWGKEKVAPLIYLVPVFPHQDSSCNYLSKLVGKSTSLAYFP